MLMSTLTSLLVSLTANINTKVPVDLRLLPSRHTGNLIFTLIQLVYSVHLVDTSGVSNDLFFM